ncbi:MAG: tRNA pseudouridine(38-40) synthase TruA [Tenericutes bacterium]|nr:tRNA pseudouridine(38-40) synthase TruA [Mycoplasmatota bacterium]
MNIDINILDDNVGLKYNQEVILGKEKVAEFIRGNNNLFIDYDIKKIGDSKMYYGYNQYLNPVKIGYKDDLIQKIIILTEPANYTRYKAMLTFDGHLYSGFQIQKDQKTIQGELTKVVSNVNGYESLVQGASRTDAGVHANNYVIHFDSIRDIGDSKWLTLLNHQLPRDIQVKSVEKTHPIFHSRYDVLMKRYIYKIKLRGSSPFNINYEWQCKNIDLDIMKNNLNQLVGTHNYRSFCKGMANSYERTIYKAEAILVDDSLTLVFEGNGFLRYMIRIIVNALYLQSTGQLDVDISNIIKEKSRKHTKDLAPAAGLYLDQIIY